MNSKKYIAIISAVLIIVMSFSTVAYGGDHDTPVIPIPQGDSSSEQTPSGQESGNDWVTPSADISGDSSTKKETTTAKTETTTKAKKKANTLTVKAKKPVVKYKNLKKKKQTIALKKAMTVSGVQGTVTYKLSSAKKGKKNVKKYFKVAKNGKITVKKGLKKGTYTVKIKVSAAGNAEYNAAVKTVTVKIKVK